MLAAAMLLAAATAALGMSWSQPVFAAPVIHMDDTISGTGQNIWSGRQIQAEYVTPSSVLVGKQIDTIVVKLKKSGLPTGDAEIGVFNSDASVKKLFATKDVSTLTTSYASYEFVLSGTPYTIEAGDRIGVKYVGGTSLENISIMRDTDPADPFDGANSYNSFFTTTWSTFANYDLTMTLKGIQPAVSDTVPPIITAAPSGGTYNSAQSVELSSNEPATIYYTSDGSNPATSGTRLLYSSPVTISASTLLKYYGIDGAGNASTPQEQNYIIQEQQQQPSPFPTIHMQDTTPTVASVTYAGRQINAEYVTPTSQLVGDKIDSITLRLQKVGAPTGTAQVGIFNADLSVKKLFATIDVATISTTATEYEFKLPAADPLYTISAGDRIGIKYTGGSTSAGINVTPDRDAADPFDGANSYRARYESSWINSTGEDLYMILRQTHG